MQLGFPNGCPPRRALRLGRLEVSDREDPFAAIIRCTADPAKADKRTRSKWSRVMRYAAAYKPNSEPLDQFIRRKAASTSVRLGSLGVWVGERQSGPRDGRQVGDEAFDLALWRHCSLTCGFATITMFSKMGDRSCLRFFRRAAQESAVSQVRF
jgi:hypothetical protein